MRSMGLIRMDMLASYHNWFFSLSLDCTTEMILKPEAPIAISMTQVSS